MTAGTLYLVPNALGDSALDTVLPSDVIALTAALGYFVGENAKSTRAFLKKIDVICPLTLPIQQIEIRELNVSTSAAALPDLIAPILAGRDGGLVSEAGCPAIADPGADLVRLAHEHGVAIVPLVGPSSILLALMASGLNGQSFAFNGYLPTDAAERTRRIRELEGRSRQERQTQIFIETPYRNMALLQALIAACGPATRLAVACDLTMPNAVIASRSVRDWRGLTPDLHRRPAIFMLLA